MRYGDPPRKPHTGIGEKPSDRYTLPLTPEEHRLGKDSQHANGEREWWKDKGIDPITLCDALFTAWEAGADIEALTQIIVAAHLGNEMS